MVVHSFAHGGRTFRLRHSAASARAVLEAAQEGAAFLYLKVLPAADVTAAEEDQLLELVHALTGIGKRPLKADLKRAKAEAARERAREERDAVDDRRSMLRAPSPDEERAPVVARIEDVLRAEHPPAAYRNVTGEIVAVARYRSPLLHLLTSDTAAGGVHTDHFAPAPESPLIRPHTTDSIREVIERRIRYVQDGKGDGPPRTVTLPEVFLDALLAPRQDSKLPLLTAISDVPLVTPNGKVVVAGGFHAASGIHFTCTEEEARALVPDDLGERAVRDAYLFLAEGLFVDVAFRQRPEGLAALVALLLTGVSNPVLSEKPIFCVNAPQRGSGKTTLVNMVHRPLTGRSAAATSWSKNEEERRKSAFAAAREGHLFNMFDNIERGTVVRDATLERFSTSAEVRDRVLGESRTEAVRSPVVVLTGNAIRMGGDGGSRTLTVELTAERPDPENREFRHPDVLGWADRHRTAILKAALTILLGNPTLRDPGAKIETRFKAWFVLVGSAVEHAAGLAGMPARMKDLFALSEAEDDTMGSLADLVELLLEAFPHGEFTVDELTKRLVAQDPLDPTTLNGRLLDAMHDVGRQPMRVVTPRVVGAVLQRNVKGVPIQRAGGRIVTVTPARRLGNADKILWKVAGDGFVPPASRPETKF